MRDFIPVLVEELDHGYDNKLESEEDINNIFADFYLDQNDKILNEEYSFIIRHISTSKLRVYFDKLANRHNTKLSPNDHKRLRFVLDYPIILNCTEQKSYKQSIQDFMDGKRKFFDSFTPNVLEPRTINWIRTELDSNGYYVGPSANLAEKYDDPEQLICKYSSAHELANIVERRKAKFVDREFDYCCLCHHGFVECWSYVIDNVHYNVCNQCMDKYSFLRKSD